MQYASLFTGIGTADYAAQLLGWPITFVCENDKYCSGLLEQQYPGVPNLGDITTARFGTFKGMVNILTGGFPCQDISRAGKGKGIDGKKSGLWRHFHRAIAVLRPEFVLIENSIDLKTKGLDKVIHDLARIGYNCEWEPFSAAEFGADHIRERLWVLAYPNSFRRQGLLRMLKIISISIAKSTEHEKMDSSSSRLERFRERHGEPPIFGVYDGLTKKLHVPKRLAIAGNAMYWPIPFSIFKMIEVVQSMTDEEWITLNYQLLE